MGIFSGILMRDPKDEPLSHGRMVEEPVKSSLKPFMNNDEDGRYIQEKRNISKVDRIVDDMVKNLEYCLGCTVGSYAHDLSKSADYAFYASHLMNLADIRVDTNSGKSLFKGLNSPNKSVIEDVKNRMKGKVSVLMETLQKYDNFQVAVKRSPNKVTGEIKIDQAGSGWIINKDNLEEYMKTGRVQVINPSINRKKAVPISELLETNSNIFTKNY